MLQVFWVNGRINRLTWWLVQIGIFSLGWAIRSMISPDLPQSKEGIAALLADKAAMMHLGQQYLAVLPLFLITLILSNWLFITSSILRLHDRNNAGWRVIFAYVPYVVIVASVINAGMKGAISVSLLGLLMGIVGILVSYVWMIVECGILPGEESPNDYGEPVGAASRRAQLKEELQAMMGGSVTDNDFEPARSNHVASPAPQPVMSFASTQAKPSFGKR